MEASEQAKPLLLVGFRVPFDQLEAEPFADFVHACLHHIGVGRKWTNLQQPDLGADGGFDSFATTASGNTACIQCKRYSEPISLPEVGHEIAKVALNAALERSIIEEHVIITTGKVRSVLRNALREDSSETLKRRAIADANHEDLAALRKRATSAGIDVDATVSAYVDKVALTVWSGHEFDAQLGLVWDQITGLLERTFVVHARVREYPRPDYDERRYAQTVAAAVDARFVAQPHEIGSLPHNVSTADAGDPWRDARSSATERRSQHASTVIDALADVSPGELYLLLGDGGVGKTTALRQLRAELLERRSENEAAPLPIMVDLGDVGPSLDHAIHAALDVHHGHWSAIPGSFVLVLDSLDDILVDNLRRVAASLRKLLAGERIAVVMAIRHAGPPRPIVLPVTRVIEALPFGPREVSELAAKELDPPSVAEFVDAWLTTVGGDSFLARPQAVAAALHSWSRRKALPRTHRELLENVLTLVRERESSRYGPLDGRLGAVPYDVVLGFARRLVENTWFETGDRNLETEVYHAHLARILREAQADGSYGSDALDSLMVTTLLVHHGFVVPTASGVRLPHETVCAYLVSSRLARTWREHVHSRSARAHDRSWLAAISLLAADEQHELLVVMAEVDLYLATCLAREANALEHFSSRLLDEARQPMEAYREQVVANALALAGTDDCLEVLREWARETGHRQRAARFALATMGDVPTVVEALSVVDRWDSGPAKMDGEERRLWESSPFSTRLVAARIAVSRSEDGLVGCSFAALQAWGTREDAPAVINAIARNTTSLTAFQRGVSALHTLDPRACEELLTNKLAIATPDTRIYLLEIASHIGLSVDADLLLDEILADEQLTPPPDPNDKMIMIGSESDNRRLLALELLEEVGLTQAQAVRSIAAIESGTSPFVTSWAWSVARTLRLPQALEIARAAIEDHQVSDIGLYYAVWMLAVSPAQKGLAKLARQRFSERFPDRCDGRMAYNLATLCEADDDREGMLEIVGAVLTRLTERIETEEARSESVFELGRWFGRIAAFPDLIRASDPIRIISWDLSGIGGVDKFVKTVLAHVEPKQVPKWMSTIRPPEWRCMVIRCVCEVFPELRSALEEQIAALMLEFVGWRAPKDLVQAVKLCWGNRLARATVETWIAVLNHRSNVAVTSRIDNYQRALGPLFTVEQANEYIGPALQIAVDPELRSILQFYFDRALAAR